MKYCHQCAEQEQEEEEEAKQKSEVTTIQRIEQRNSSKNIFSKFFQNVFKK
jgi:hypothetical protein